MTILTFLITALVWFGFHQAWESYRKSRDYLRNYSSHSGSSGGTIITPYNPRKNEANSSPDEKIPSMDDIFRSFGDVYGDLIKDMKTTAYEGKIHSFFLQKNGQEEGPFSAQYIKDLELPADTLVTEESINNGIPVRIGDLDIDSLAQQEIELLESLAGKTKP